MESNWSPLPDHIDPTVQAIARLHAEHDNSATRLERLCDDITAGLARPVALGIVLVFVGVWLGTNMALRDARMTPLDPPPFVWLQLAMTLAAMLMTIVILTSQRRSDHLASR